MTENQYTKLVSVRIEKDLVNKLDAFLIQHYYYNRSTLINRILAKTIGQMSDDELFDLIKN